MSLHRRTSDPPADSTAVKKSSAPRSARFGLREATAADHERLDRLYSRFDLRQADDYSAFLLAHAPALMGVERALEDAGAATLLPGWCNRKRGEALLNDIAAMGLTAPESSKPPTLSNEAQVLGAAYVLEGSRLGGAMLIRTVAPGLPTAFLQPGNPADWRAFIGVLNERLSSDGRLAEAVSVAKMVFKMFEQSARVYLEPTGLDL